MPNSALPPTSSESCFDVVVPLPSAVKSNEVWPVRVVDFVTTVRHGFSIDCESVS